MVYFRVDPMFGLFGDEWTLEIEYRTVGEGTVLVDYSSISAPALFQDQQIRATAISKGTTGRWTNTVFLMESPRFTRASNLGDFRLVATEGITDIHIRSLTLKRIRERVLSPLMRSLLYSGNSPVSFPDEAAPACSIIIPVHNHFEYTRACLNSLRSTLGLPAEIIVIDNASTDETCEQLAQYRGIRLLANTINTGFARACNAGAVEAKGRFLVFLNNDTIPLNGWLENLLSPLENDPAIGVTGACLIYPQTEEVQHAGIRFDHNSRPYHRYRMASRHSQAADRSLDLNAVTGACLATTRDLFHSIGGFDEKFVNGYEDVDLCLRVRQRGYRIRYTANSVLYHFESATVGRLDGERESANLRNFDERWHDHLQREEPEPLEYHWVSLPLLLDGNILERHTGVLVENRVYCRPGKDPPGHCTFGPGISLNGIDSIRVCFALIISEIATTSEALVSLDIYDNHADKIIWFQEIRAGDFPTDELSEIISETEIPTDSALEFRVFWHGHCRLCVRHIELGDPTLQASW